MKKAEIVFKPGMGVAVGAVTPLGWFLEEMEKMDLTKVTHAAFVTVLEDGTVGTLFDGESKLVMLGALSIAEQNLRDSFGSPEDADEEDDDEDSGN